MCLYFVNVIFLALALLLISIGAIIQSSLNGEYGLFIGYVSIPAALIIAFGALLFLASLLALLGIYYRSHCLLSVYTCTLIVLIVVEMSMGTAGFVFSSRALRLTARSMRSAQSKYTNSRSVNVTWDFVQRNLKCCGVDDYTEWFQYLDNSSLPDSCCVLYTVGCGSDAISSGNLHQTGCASAISKWTHRHEIQATILFTFIIVLQLWSILCTRKYQSVISQYKSLFSP